MRFNRKSSGSDWCFQWYRRCGGGGFAQEGVTLVLVSRQLHKLQRVTAKLAHDRHMVVQADVADRQATESPWQVMEMGCYARIDVLVNNAGVQRYLARIAKRPGQLA